MLLAIRAAHPCVAFLPFRCSFAATQIRALSQGIEELRRPYPRPPDRSRPPPKAACLSNRRSRTDDYRLGRQRNGPRGPLHASYHSVPGVQPLACGQFPTGAPRCGAQGTWPVAAEDGHEIGRRSGDTHGMGGWAASAHREELESDLESSSDLIAGARCAVVALQKAPQEFVAAVERVWSYDQRKVYAALRKGNDDHEETGS